MIGLVVPETEMKSNVVAPEVAHWVNELRSSVDSVRNAHFRLVWVVGGNSAHRSSVLAAAAEALECPNLKVGRQLSEVLLDLSPRLRAATAEEAFQDLLLGADSEVLCLDHLEILFDPSLRLKAVDLIQNASRRFVLIASWPGLRHNDSLVFGPADHPAFVRVTLDQLADPLIALS